ncbi:MAG: hypothetical protein DRI36_05925, partial [Caldiserica bacterium]
MDKQLNLNKKVSLLYFFWLLSLWVSMKFLNSFLLLFLTLLGILLVIYSFVPFLLLSSIGLMVPFGISQDLVGDFTVYSPELIIFVSAIGWFVYGIKRRKLFSYFKELNIWIIFFCVLFLSLIGTFSLSSGIKEILRWGEVF